MAAEKPLAFMTAVSATIATYTPSDVNSDDDATSGSSPLIVLATWYAANDAHVAKYVKGYRAAFPQSRILILRNFASHFLLPQTVRSEMAQAAQMIYNATRDSNQLTEQGQPQMLLHVFSNGGCNTAHYLLEALQAHDAQHAPPLPSYTLILDSCPGYFEKESTYRATVQPLPAWAHPLVYVGLRIVFGIAYMLGVAPFQDRNAASLLGGELVRYERSRAYLYSDTDAFVEWRDVEDHAARAEAAGFSVVVREKFHGAGHVALARSEPERYWALVRRAWRGEPELERVSTYFVPGDD
ncbi:hypothetical protein K4F52_006593 [Lecanicillium sp. MT-2017a]|nr:hypothetical protein K4F52_006593 [Lecanicillium sp. MT-2017a]